ncbi:MAG TPA: YciI family protein [Devosiaceae bacterium]|nr:YciI family protein [Devosiaceae bacterium]
MTKYLFAYHGGATPETPEEGQKVMAAWVKWMGGLGAALVDGGNPIGSAKTVAKDGTVSEGGGANLVTGYSIVEAPSLDAAVKMAQSCPILASGGSVEVGETFAVM